MGRRKTKHPHLNADWFIEKPTKRRESLGLDHEARRRCCRRLVGGAGEESPLLSCSVGLASRGRDWPSEGEGEASRGSKDAMVAAASALGSSAVRGLLSFLLEPIMLWLWCSFLWKERKQCDLLHIDACVQPPELLGLIFHNSLRHWCMSDGEKTIPVTRIVRADGI